MDGDLKGVEQLYIWNKRVLSFGGMWPLDKTFFKFYAGFLYFFLHMVQALGDFVDVFGDLSLTIANLLETSIQIMVTAKMMVFRHSDLLKQVLREVQSGINEDKYKDQTEKNLYLSYNTIGRIFFVTGHYLGVITGVSMYLKPFEDFSKAVLRNETINLILPYRVRLFINITDTRTYFLAYLWQGPMMYYYYLHGLSICFLCALIVHVTGDLSILAHRIRHINRSDPSSDCLNLRTAFRDVVVEHHRIIRTAAAIEEVYKFILLEELVISTMLIGLTFYNTLVKSVAVSVFEFLFVSFYCTSLIVVILIYCITGDFLIRESENVHDAYYECRWYDMSSEYRKDLIICMSRAKKPLQLTAGRFYVFSLARFSEILKTAMAYISMLRTVV